MEEAAAEGEESDEGSSSVNVKSSLGSEENEVTEATRYGSF